MKNVNVFISVSFWEGGPNVLIEALKYQINIVCSSYPSSFEYLENGKYGEIFENNLGATSGINIERGVNASWTKGGILYSPPFR